LYKNPSKTKVLKVLSSHSDPSSDITVTVGGATLPAMEPGRMREVVCAALLTFDIIQFNLVSLLQRLD
jgi:hypothetical protein